MIISKKNMLSTAVRAALIGAIAIPMVGCDDAETYNQQSYVEAQENYTQQQRQQLVGQVNGVVLDSNGNPLADADVSIGTQTTTTDALGYYAFADVAAVNVVLNGEDEFVAMPIEISVKADGHLGGRTQAYPTAISDTEQYVYIDGFTAQAKNLYLPELDASVKATLRSDITGEAVANKKVTVEFLALNNAELGEFGSLASHPLSVTTDVNGAFEVFGLPANSTFQVLVEGYSVDGQYVLDEAGKTVSSVFSTSDEPIVSNWGEVFITKQIVADLINPFVRNIQHVTASADYSEADLTATPVILPEYTGYLAKGKDGTSATGGLVFELSESVSILNRKSNNILDDNTIKVLRTLGTNSAEYLDFTTVQSSTNVTSIQVNLVNPLAPGEEINVYFEIEDFVDANNNRLTTEGLAATEDDSSTPDTDESKPFHRVADSIGVAEKANYVRYNIIAYQPSTQINGSGTIEQNVAVHVAPFETLSEHNAAFKGHGDFDQDSAPSTEISQINSAANANTGALLQSLAAALDDASAIGAPDKVFANTALIKVNFPSNTTSAKVVISSGGVENTAATTALQSLVDGVDLSQEQTFVVKGVAPGEKITITPKDGFGVENKEKAFEYDLVDNIAPTTVLQDSYDVTGDEDGHTVTGKPLGGAVTIDGGSRVTVGEIGELGYPYLAITPAILNINDKEQDILGDLVNNGVNDDTAEADVYDKDDFETWSLKPATTAVAFSETVKWISSSAPTQGSVAPSVTSNLLSNFDIVANTAATQDDVNKHGVSQAKDFVTFKVDNLFTFANDNNNKELTFTHLLEDTAGNNASAAKVIVQDKLPPMIASAELTGEQGDVDSQELKITFSETVSPKSTYTADDDALVFKMNIAGNTYSTSIANSLDASDIDFSGDTITIEINELNPTPNFTRAQEITDLKVHIADLNGNEGHTQYGDELVTTYNYNHVLVPATPAKPEKPAEVLLFKVDNKITVAP